MTTTIRQAAIARLQRTDWAAIGHRIDGGIRHTIAAAELLAMLAALAWETAYEHREQIRQALIHAIAVMVLATIRTYRAGRWTRQQIERLSRAGAVALQLTPLQAIATARAALERLVRRMYPALA